MYVDERFASGNLVPIPRHFRRVAMLGGGGLRLCENERDQGSQRDKSNEVASRLGTISEYSCRDSEGTPYSIVSGIWNVYCSMLQGVNTLVSR